MFSPNSSLLNTGLCLWSEILDCRYIHTAQERRRWEPQLAILSRVLSYHILQNAVKGTAAQKTVCHPYSHQDPGPKPVNTSIQFQMAITKLCCGWFSLSPWHNLDSLRKRVSLKNCLDKLDLWDYLDYVSSDGRNHTLWEASFLSWAMQE